MAEEQVISVGNTPAPQGRVNIAKSIADKISAAAGQAPASGTEPPKPAEPPTQPKPDAATGGQRQPEGAAPSGTAGAAKEGEAPAGTNTTTGDKAGEKAGTPEKAPKKSGIEQVREAHDRAEARARELEGSLTATAKEKAEAFEKLAAAEAKLRTFEERFQKEYKPQLEKLSEREKRLEELQTQLQQIDYTRTPEFHERHIKPIAEASRDVEDILKQVEVIGPDGKPQPATIQHFNALLATPSLNEAERVAKQLFGEGFATTELVRASAKIRSLQRGLKEAQERASVEAVEYFKRQEEEQVAQQSRLRQLIDTKVRELVPQVPSEDAEAIGAWSEGTKFVEEIDRVAQSRDVERVAETAARVRARVQEYPLMALRERRLKAENEALRAELAAYRGSEPKVETSGGGAPSADRETEQGVPLRGTFSRQSQDHIMKAIRAAAQGR
jgi:nucleotide-binding universal stress UspA family protein